MHISYKPLWHTLLERDMRNTVSKQLVALRSSASDNRQLQNAKKARKYAIFRAFSIPKILPGLFGFDGI